MGPLRPDYKTLARDFIQDLGEAKLIVFDFDGVFTDNQVIVSENGTEAVTCWRSDGLGLSKIRSLKIPVWVISTEKNPVVGARCNKLGINCIQACDDKLKALKELAKKYGCLLGEVIYTGNDINDQPCLDAAGLSMVVADAHPEVIGSASYVTLNPGGRGAVREICDLVEYAHNQIKV